MVKYIIPQYGPHFFLSNVFYDKNKVYMYKIYRPKLGWKYRFRITREEK